MFFIEKFILVCCVIVVKEEIDGGVWSYGYFKIKIKEFEIRILSFEEFGFKFENIFLINLLF